MEGRKVKVYKSFNSDQIALRKEIGDILKDNVLFPKVIANDDKFIVEEWIVENLSQN